MKSVRYGMVAEYEVGDLIEGRVSEIRGGRSELCVSEGAMTIIWL